MHRCTHCKRTFRYAGNWRKHAELCKDKKRKSCTLCQRQFNTLAQKVHHEKVDHAKKLYGCRSCSESFETRRNLYIHRGLQHGGGETLRDWVGGTAPWENPNGTVRDPELKRIIEANRRFILGDHRVGQVASTYNFPTNNLDNGPREFETHLNEIYRKEDESFKLNMAFGTVIRHLETGEHRYFVPYENGTVFPEPLTITRREDVDKAKESLSLINPETHFLTNRPDTKWQVVLITNVTYFVSRTGYPLGRGLLPDFLRRKMCLVGLDRDERDNPITDALCAFRCLAVHRQQADRETATEMFYRQWAAYVAMNTGKRLAEAPADFRGLKMDQMADFEKCFSTSVYVYEMKPDETVLLRHKPFSRFPEKMHLNLYQGHLSYVKNFAQFAKKFECTLCQRNFSNGGHFNRHVSTCSAKTKYRYKDGYYSNPLTVFEELEHLGIVVPERDRLYEDFAVFDCEAMLRATDAGNSPKLKWLHKHECISVSVCSNVPDFKTPHCIVNENMAELVTSMLSYLEEIQKKAEERARTKWADALNSLSRLKQQLIEREGEEAGEGEQEVVEDQNDDDDDDDEDDNDEVANRVKKRKSLMLRAVQKAESKFLTYVTTLPILGYNSARYDLNLLKSEVLKQLNLQDKGSFVIKKENVYVCITSAKLKFLDVCQYLSPGVSYSKFLKAYDVPEEKSHFCYEYLDCPEKLNEPALPPHAAFYSSLKKTNITLKEYAELGRVWDREGMHTLRDLLVYYNNKDVGPFVEGVVKLQKFYFDKNLDLFKVTVSAPGAARRLLFQAAMKENARFATLGEKDEDLYLTYKKNLVGGPAIIFTRKHVKGETLLRQGPNLCQRILGLDMNGLYLYCISLPHCTGNFVRRREETGFKPEKHTKYQSMYTWMEWKNVHEGHDIKHALNNHGGEIRFGPYPVDGYEARCDTIYQLDGCYHHGDFCQIGKMPEVTRLERARRTRERDDFLRKRGHTLVIKKECEFRADLKRNAHFREFAKSLCPEFYRSHPGKTTGKEILDAVERGTLFGAVEVDIEVPQNWPEGKERNLPPAEYFSEMCPLFGTVNVEMEHIGDHMRTHVENFDLSKKPRRLLVSALRATKVLLATPLLRWYLEHGLIVTRVYQAVEFIPKACFKTFENEVTTARRAGDVDPSKSIIADTMKLLGNSAYGGVIMQKERQHKVSYFTTPTEAMRAVNSPRFRKMTELPDLFEVESAKAVITLDLPIFIGFTILNYAKAAMLAFYYDALDEMISRVHYEALLMDTDSIYFGLARETLEEAMTEEGRRRYLSERKHLCRDGAKPRWFTRDCCDRHRAFDRRVPGLMKEEASGEALVALASKTYVLKSGDGHKLSCKGINKASVENPMDTYASVLSTKRSADGVNRGLRAWAGTVFTYEQSRSGFSYLYAKRRVHDCGIKTSPLDITLCPWETVPEREVVETPWHPLSPESPCDMPDGFWTAEQTFLYEMATFHEARREAEAIRRARDPSEVRAYAAMVRTGEGWLLVKDEVMKRILTVKARRNDKVKRCLRHDKPIVFARRDRYWGVGMVKRVVDLTPADGFRGRNKLGELWERVRDELQMNE